MPDIVIIIINLGIRLLHSQQKVHLKNTEIKIWTDKCSVVYCIIISYVINYHLLVADFSSKVAPSLWLFQHVSPAEADPWRPARFDCLRWSRPTLYHLSPLPFVTAAFRWSSRCCVQCGPSLWAYPEKLLLLRSAVVSFVLRFLFLAIATFSLTNVTITRRWRVIRGLVSLSLVRLNSVFSFLHRLKRV